MRSLQPAIPADQQGFTLVEVLVAAVIFAGVFLLMFTMLGSVLMRTSGSDKLRAAGIADIRLAAFYSADKGSLPEDSVTVDGVLYRINAVEREEKQRRVLRLTISRATNGDTVGTFYAVKYLSQEEAEFGLGAH